LLDYDIFSAYGKQGDLDLAEGYWSEFFLLKPDKPSFQKKLDSVDAEDLLHFQVNDEIISRNVD
jgi:hypothetical protein